MLLEREVDLCEPAKRQCIRIGALFDTGAGHSFISKEVAETLDWAERKSYEPPFIHQGPTKEVMESVSSVWLRFKCSNGKYSSYIEFFAVAGLMPRVIVGAIAMEQMGARFKLGMEPGENDLTLNCEPLPVGPVGFGSQEVK